MHLFAVIGLVAYLSFSLGMIAGCLIMTKGDSSSEPRKIDKTSTLSTNELMTAESPGQGMGK